MPVEPDWSCDTLDFYGNRAVRLVGEGVDFGAVEQAAIDRLFSDRPEPWTGPGLPGATAWIP